MEIAPSQFAVWSTDGLRLIGLVELLLRNLAIWPADSRRPLVPVECTSSQSCDLSCGRLEATLLGGLLLRNLRFGPRTAGGPSASSKCFLHRNLLLSCERGGRGPLPNGTWLCGAVLRLGHSSICSRAPETRMCRGWLGWFSGGGRGRFSLIHPACR